MTLSSPPVRKSGSTSDLYLAWLARELARDGAVRIDEARVLRFGGTRILRRGRERDFILAIKPYALFRGTVTVVDPTAFDLLLRRGIGRHRSFGFGFLGLRPPGS